MGALISRIATLNARTTCVRVRLRVLCERVYARERARGDCVRAPACMCVRASA